MITLIPADRHLPSKVDCDGWHDNDDDDQGTHLLTASGTAALGGSIIDINPVNLSPVRGKLKMDKVICVSLGTGICLLYIIPIKGKSFRKFVDWNA